MNKIIFLFCLLTSISHVVSNLTAAERFFGDNKKHCPLCSYTCDKQKTLHEHLYKEHNFPFSNLHRIRKCFTCGTSFKNAETLRKHLSKMPDEHYDAYLKPYYRLYYYHAEQHASHKPYVKRARIDAATNEALEPLLWLDPVATTLDDGSAGWKCPWCKYKNYRKSIVEIHLRRHTGEKPFQCRLCLYAAPTNSDLTKHISKIHTDSKEPTPEEDPEEGLSPFLSKDELAGMLREAAEAAASSIAKSPLPE